MSDLRPRRSVLYLPASNTRALEKAKDLPADSLIFDLEDAVAPDAKASAREQAVAAVGSGAYGNRELTIRCNALDSPWGLDDVAAIAQAQPDAIVVPKVSDFDDLHTVAEALEAAGATDTDIWPMVETPSAMLKLDEIATFHRTSVIVMGTNDLVKELQAKRTPERTGLLPHLATAILHARAAGKVIIDGVFNDITDASGFLTEATQGFELGFDGKTLIHPKQIEPTNGMWTPSADEVEHAQRVIEAFTEAQDAGQGVVTVDGQMIENLHVEEARRCIAISEAVEKP